MAAIDGGVCGFIDASGDPWLAANLPNFAGNASNTVGRKRKLRVLECLLAKHCFAYLWRAINNSLEILADAPNSKQLEGRQKC